MKNSHLTTAIPNYSKVSAEVYREEEWCIIEKYKTSIVEVRCTLLLEFLEKGEK